MTDRLSDKQAAEAVMRWALWCFDHASLLHTQAIVKERVKYATDVQHWNRVHGGKIKHPLGSLDERLRKNTSETLKVQRHWEDVRNFVTHTICNLVEEKP